MATGSGYGKVILFGEHFVVHGNHAIVSAISNSTIARVVRGEKPGIELLDNRPAAPGYKSAKAKDQEKSLSLILGAMDIDPSTPLRIELGGDLYVASGVGASAAFCTSIARALSEHFSMNLSDEEINNVAFEGEKGYHGRPSGVDNTASTFGGLMWFKKTVDGLEHEKIDIERPVKIVMANSGPTANTTAAVKKVADLKESDPEGYARIARNAEDAAAKARKALEEHSLEEVGRLMDINHGLLQEVGVSTPLLDDMVKTARGHGAMGAKLTGGGMGGYMFALVGDGETQKKVAKALDNMDDAITVIETEIG